MLAKGLGVRLKDVNRLFNAFNGTQEKGISIDHMDSIISKIETPHKKPENVLNKPPPKEHIPGARAERMLRESMRQTHTFLKKELERMERHGTIPPSSFLHQRVLFDLIAKHAKHLNYADWRYILRRLQHNDNNEVSWKHFIHLFDPSKAPHTLNGTIGIKEFEPLSYVYSTTSGKQTMVREKKTKSTLTGLTSSTKRLKPRERALLKKQESEKWEAEHTIPLLRAMEAAQAAQKAKKNKALGIVEDDAAMNDSIEAASQASRSNASSRPATAPLSAELKELGIAAPFGANNTPSK